MSKWYRGSEHASQSYLCPAAILIIALLPACSGITHKGYTDVSDATSCPQLFQTLDNFIQAEEVMDAQDRRVEGFPYLRVDRFISSYRNEVREADFEQWLDLMLARGITGWSLEYANLGTQSQAMLLTKARTIDGNEPSFYRILENCANQQRQADFTGTTDSETFASIRRQAVVEDNYSLLKRTLGLYPLTAIAFRGGISEWHQEILEDYATPLSQLDIAGPLISYAPVSSERLSREQVQKVLRESAINPLAIPLPDKQARKALLSTYAPLYEVEQATIDDQFGFPLWKEGTTLEIELQRPSVFNYLSWTRFQGQALLQLNYLVWFPARTAKSRYDILSGKLDGLLWRVTLQSDGEPLVFDSIHACGCYHLFYAGNLSRPLPSLVGIQEPAFFPNQQGYSFTDLPLSLRIGAGNHYLRRVVSQADSVKSNKRYMMYSADLLRSLPESDYKRRSLYGPNGLIKSSFRSERFFFWPMGIASPGTMRQRGHHATAFTGRRHFDDARLFDSIIAREAP